MRTGVFATPRAVPGHWAPALAGTAVIVLALPIFAIAGWPLEGWALAAVLWAGAQALSAVLTRLSLDPSNVAASSMRGVGTSFRAFAVGIVLVAVTIADEAVGLAALLVYGLAFTLELAVGVVSYLGSDPTR